MALLEMSGVRKAFPGVLALDNVDFQAESGEVRALMGENGAGKSTLIKVLTGVHPMDEGVVRLDGQLVQPRTPSHAQELGISTVYQEIDLVPNLTVAENICLGREPRRFGALQWREMYRRAKGAVQRLGIDVDVAKILGDCPIAVQQLVSIARAVDRDARVLVLDEPTSSLDRDEVAQLFGLMRDLKNRGIAIVFVTHFLEQVYAIADSVTILRNGAKVGDWGISDLSQEQLIAHMLGRELETLAHKATTQAKEAEEGFHVTELGKKKTLQPVSFGVGRGEVVGLSGLLGSGRTETMKLVFGALAADSGAITKNDKQFRPKTARDSVKRGIGFCPEDRKREAVFPGLSVADNLLIVVQARRGWMRPLSRKKRDAIVAANFERFQIKAPSPEVMIESLSGGNQQKVVLSRWLAAEPELLMLDEPTRGIDVGSKFEIRKTIRELAKTGTSFLFSSSELEEVVHTSDRVIVLRDRAKVGELSGDFDESDVMAAIAKGGE